MPCYPCPLGPWYPCSHSTFCRQNKKTPKCRSQSCRQKQKNMKNPAPKLGCKMWPTPFLEQLGGMVLCFFGRTEHAAKIFERFSIFDIETDISSLKGFNGSWESSGQPTLAPKAAKSISWMALGLWIEPDKGSLGKRPEPNKHKRNTHKHKQKNNHDNNAGGCKQHAGCAQGVH